MHSPDKILIIRFSSLGDIILASPLVRILRAAYPLARIDFLVKSEYAELLKFNRALSSVIELKTSNREELKELKRRIRSERYDVIVDIHNSLRSRYLRWFSAAGRIRVVNKRAIQRFALVAFRWNLYRSVIPVSDRYLETVRSLGLRDDGLGPEVHVPDETGASVKSMMEKYRLDRYETVIGMAPGARHFTKRWPLERFVELGEKAAHAGKVKILVLGSRSEREYCGDIVQQINANLGSAAAENLAGTLSLLETAAVLDSCTIIVSNDSGIMHMAVARKRPVVAIFGSTVREFGFFPSGAEDVVVERMGLSCRPCSHIGLEFCPRGHFRCMKEIDSSEVWEAASKVLAGRQ